MSSELEKDVCYHVWLAPSGESYRGKKVIAGLVKSNCSLLPSGWPNVTCRLTPGLTQGPTLGNKCGRTTFFTRCPNTNDTIRFITSNFHKCWHFSFGSKN